MSIIFNASIWLLSAIIDYSRLLLFVGLVPNIGVNKFAKFMKKNGVKMWKHYDWDTKTQYITCFAFYKHIPLIIYVVRGTVMEYSSNYAIYTLRIFEYILDDFKNVYTIREDVTYYESNAAKDSNTCYMSRMYATKHDGFKKIFIKNEMEERVSKKLSKVYENMLKNREVSRNKFVVLFYGPPGNGKTIYADYFAKKFGLDICYVGIEKDMKLAHITNCISHGHNDTIYVFNDIDNIYDDKREIKEGYALTTTSLLELFDGIRTSNLIAFISTNYLEKMPENFRRAGRIDELIEVSNPDAKMINEMCNHYKYVGDRTAFLGKSCAQIIDIIS